MRTKLVITLLVLSSPMSIHAQSESKQAPHLATAFREIIESAKKQVYPALVFVKPIREEASRGEKKLQEVFGSGVIISPEGFAITNNHVIDKAIEIRVVLSDKRQVRGELVGTDPETDLALIKLVGLKPNETLPYAEFAHSSTVRSGDFVLALGSPFGYARSISLGIVSNSERYLGSDSKFVYNNFIQTDAAINPGNSGGPLINLDGQIVGINTLVSTVGQGLGFSIPSDVVREVSERLRVNKDVKRAWTGLKLQPLTDYRTNTFTNSPGGVLVRHVEKDSPAHLGGIIAGDVLMKIDDQAIEARFEEDLPAIERRLADLSIDKPQKMLVQRGDQALTIELTPKTKGKIDLKEFVCKTWNMTVKDFSEFSDPDLYFYEKGGIYVLGVRSPGNAQRAGLRRRDIVLKIDNKPVKSVDDAQKIYESLIQDKKRRPRVLVHIRRGAFQQPIVLDYREDFLK